MPYDPCCGGAYHLRVLAYSHGHAIRKVIRSDIDEAAVSLAEKNLGLLHPTGIDARFREIETAFEIYGKESHVEDWGFASKSTGWRLRLKQEKRTVLYMTPCEGHFLASFALGEKAVKAADESALPASVLEVIDSARKYAEGKGVRLVVKTARDVHHVETLAAIKMAN